MNRKLVLVAAIAAMGLASVVVSKAAEKDSPIVTVMTKVFKPGKNKAPSIVKKAGDGKATAEELKTLLEQLKVLKGEKAPKGEAKDWDERNTALIAATEGLIKGDAGSADKLKTAANCKKCHDLHKGD